ncbi:Uncharacterized protein BM_BM1237 [Brugia malayi]|nr:Uncharacterized protein BM_BM1237 [Brugia malayi]CDP93846.1 Bm1237 [Brugia malayi]VIO95093.1 Uncharacterized protein BM_BM1237 [Brugia malayi]
MLDHRNIAKGIRARNMFASGNSIKLTTAALIIIIQLLLLSLIKIV